LASADAKWASFLRFWARKVFAAPCRGCIHFRSIAGAADARGTRCDRGCRIFASLGKNVLLIVDSLTRFAMAQREIGLAAGEPPTAKGYTPSVLNMLARLVERTGNFSQGSITAFYTVLMEGDDQQDPVVDTVRSLLDGHVLLDRNLAFRNHYPPISILDSVSRLMTSMVSDQHLAKASALRSQMAVYNRSEDLIRIGAYQKNSDPMLDKAIENLPAIAEYLKQKPDEFSTYDKTVERLLALPV
jgi:flagellum-specific ATP synthase